MNTSTKVLIGAGVVAAGTGIYLLQLNRTGNELESVVRAQIFKVSLSGLTLRVDAQLKNPTGKQIKIKFPFVKMIYKGTTVGSSQVVDKEITIPKFGQVMIEKIMLDIPVMSLLSAGADMTKAFINGTEAITLDVKTIAPVILALDKTFPYEKTDSITLRAKQAA
jgi:hypothetical protein